MKFFRSPVVARDELEELNRCIDQFPKTGRIELETFGRNGVEIFATQCLVEVRESEEMLEPILARAVSNDDTGRFSLLRHDETTREYAKR